MNNGETLRNRFTETYKTRHPFVNAGMAFVGSTADLPLAVMNAGAMGTFAVGALNPDELHRCIQEIRAGSESEALNINLIVPFTSETHIDLLCEQRPAVVSFHWGPVPGQWIERLQAAGVDIWEQVGSVDEALSAVRYGVDALIVQGIEAGGHNRSTLPLFVLLPEVRKELDSTMIIAAGGITNGQQMAAALALGADAVWVGSRFIASEEANAHPVYKQQIVDSRSGSDTVLTHVFGRQNPDFNPYRVLSNETTARWHHQVEKISPDYPERIALGETEINGHSVPVDQFAGYPPMKNTTGEIASMGLACGQGIGLIDQVESVDEIILAMVKEACDSLQTLNQKISD